MSQPDDSATSAHSDDEHELPDEIDWNAVRSIDDELQPETTAPAQVEIQPSVPEERGLPIPMELPPRPGSSSSSYFPDGIEVLDGDDIYKLDEMEREYGLNTGEYEQSTPRLYYSPHISMQREFLRMHPRAPLVLLTLVNADSQTKVTCPCHSRNPGFFLQQIQVRRERKSYGMTRMKIPHPRVSWRRSIICS